jgi:hypothetical protein
MAGATGSAVANVPAPSAQAAVATLVAHRGQRSGAHMVILAMFQEVYYILARWETADGNSGGEALAKFTPSGWTLVAMTGGSLASYTGLTELRVPDSVARALVRDVNAAGHH